MKQSKCRIVISNRKYSICDEKTKLLVKGIPLSKRYIYELKNVNIYFAFLISITLS